MANVALSETLQTHIRRNATKPFNDQIMELVRLPKNLSDEFYFAHMVTPELKALYAPESSIIGPS